MTIKKTAIIFAALGSFVATTYCIHANASGAQPSAPTDQTSSQSTQPQPKDPTQVCTGKSEGDSCTINNAAGACTKDQNGQLACTAK